MCDISCSRSLVGGVSVHLPTGKARMTPGVGPLPWGVLQTIVLAAKTRNFGASRSESEADYDHLPEGHRDGVSGLDVLPVRRHCWDGGLDVSCQSDRSCDRAAPQEVRHTPAIKFPCWRSHANGANKR